MCSQCIPSSTLPSGMHCQCIPKAVICQLLLILKMLLLTLSVNACILPHSLFLSNCVHSQSHFICQQVCATKVAHKDYFCQLVHVLKALPLTHIKHHVYTTKAFTRLIFVSMCGHSQSIPRHFFVK